MFNCKMRPLFRVQRGDCGFETNVNEYRFVLYIVLLSYHTSSLVSQGIQSRICSAYWMQRRYPGICKTLYSFGSTSAMWFSKMFLFSGNPLSQLVNQLGHLVKKFERAASKFGNTVSMTLIECISSIFSRVLICQLNIKAHSWVNLFFFQFPSFLHTFYF